MGAASIGASKAGGYARYLESKTIAPELGDYYTLPTGEPTQAPGRWLASADTLARLGIEGETVSGREFVSLMEGKHPRTGEWLRPEGAGGGRGGGIDLTFSAPKSVSITWALAGEHQRREVEAAHRAAADRALAHLRESVPAVRRKQKGEIVHEPAADLIAAEYRHTTARGILDGDVPDPQLHSHVVLTSVVREDGRIVAVASRPIFRAARELGAFYRSALADELRQRGYRIQAGTGRQGRFFEIAGVPRSVVEAFSARTREVTRAAERFRAKHGRAPDPGELRHLKLENRRQKTPVTRGDLQRAWNETAAGHDFHAPQPDGARERDATQRIRELHAPAPEAPLEDRVETRLTEQAATFTASELRAVLLEQTVGDLPPEGALAKGREMIANRRILPLEGGLLTTLSVRAAEQAIERRIGELAKPAGRDVGETARQMAGEQVAERIGGRLSDEQAHALQTITGPERAAIMVGPAGTGKGVVIDAAARAEQLTGRQTYGIAVSGSTAQRLGRDSPALQGQTLTLDALVARTEHGRLQLDPDTTVFFDESGMADTDRLDRLTRVLEQNGAKLVLVGDAAQLPSIGAGGMFDRLTDIAPSAELFDVRRTLDPDEQRAWANLRAGRADRAMAHYQSKGRLHMADTRDEAIEHAVKDWAKLTETLPVEQVALISDASNKEIDRINARAQHHRAQRGELGEREVEIPGTHYAVRQGDRVALTDQHHEPGRERFENGERGQVIDISQAGEVSVQFDLTGRKATLAGEDLANLRLAYASHIHRAQGATVTRTIVVTGSWQTSKEPAYVEASRARHGTDWHVSRADLGEEGHDTDRIQRLAEAMRTSRAQTPSLAHAEQPHPASQRPGRDLHTDTATGRHTLSLRDDPARADRLLENHIPPSRAPIDPHAQLAIPPSRRPLPGLARTIRRLATPTRDLSRSR